MLENDSNPKSLEQEISECPIHKWINVDELLRQLHIPRHLHEPFHKLVIARGKYPAHIKNSQAEIFETEALELTQLYEFDQIEAQAIRLVFGELIRQWISYHDTLQ